MKKPQRFNITAQFVPKSDTSFCPQCIDLLSVYYPYENVTLDEFALDNFGMIENNPEESVN